MPRDYIYDQGFSEERARLASMESLWDPGSRLLLEAARWSIGWPVAAPPCWRRRIRFDQVAEAVITFMQQAGFEPRHGRRVVADLAQPGRPTFTVDAGLLSREDAVAAAARFAGDIRLQLPLMIAGIGCR